MIVILGSLHEDVLYFETILKNRISGVPIFDRFPIVQGTIFNQDITICYGASTSYLVGPLTEILIQTYKPTILIQTGRCKALTSDWKNGDIAINDINIALDVDQCEYRNVKLGQIPGFDFEYHTNLDIMRLINEAFDKFLIGNVFNARFLSSNAIPGNGEDLKNVSRDGFFLGHHERVVTDSETFSSMIIAHLNNTPFIAVKAVDSKLGEFTGITNYVKTLDTYAKIGKAIVSFIGEIGRHDLMEE